MNNVDSPHVLTTINEQRTKVSTASAAGVMFTIIYQTYIYKKSLDIFLCEKDVCINP